VKNLGQSIGSEYHFSIRMAPIFVERLCGFWISDASNPESRSRQAHRIRAQRLSGADRSERIEAIEDSTGGSRTAPTRTLKSRIIQACGFEDIG